MAQELHLIYDEPYEVDTFGLPIKLFDGKGNLKIKIEKAKSYQLELPLFKGERLESWMPKVLIKEGVITIHWPFSDNISKDNIEYIINYLNWYLKEDFFVSFDNSLI